jgi:7-cyano-7-deazaguanine reductase
MPHKTEQDNRQRAEILDRFEAPDRNQITTFNTGELTALCPFEFGGPDFYELTLRYQADQYAVESKSLKQYVESWRDAEISAEGLADCIYEDVMHVAAPARLYVHLAQARRGGITETVEVGDIALR